ncbi:MAG: SRPBCC domain-containing protein [Betaproteobacteria bacterium]|nr:MAG: SRPBCC domain-containing protein [Betaproteobacteria bacterium]
MQRAVVPAHRIVLRLVLSVLLGLSVPTLSHAAERAIDKEISIAASLDDAWSAWTTRDGIVSFFAPEAVIDARVGGAFHIHINPLGEPGSKGADDMRFLALQPKQMISFDWNAPPHLPEARAQRTFVIVRFVAVDDKTTKVTLHHTGWGNGGEWDKTFSYFERAWGSVLGNLKKRFETGPLDWTPWLAQLKKMRDDAAAKK